MKWLLLFSMVILSMTHSCKDMFEGDIMRHFVISNSTNHDIYMHVGLGKDFYFPGDKDRDFAYAYPDTLIVENKPKKDLNLIKTGEEKGFTTDLSDFKLFEQLPSDTLSIYIFHADTIANQSWDRIKDEYMVLKRYDLSLEDLKSLDISERGRPERIVSYPPSEEMDGMRMYPR